jgi:hypothetical protein
MSGYTDLAWEWPEPCDLEISFTEGWAGKRLSVWLDVFSRQSDTALVSGILEKAEEQVIEAGGLDVKGSPIRALCQQTKRCHPQISYVISS